MARRIACLIEEKDYNSKQRRAKDQAIKVERRQEYLKNLSIQESRTPTPKREEVLSLNLVKDPQQCKVTMPRGDKNKNGKRNPEM
jgi:hypothetical protein